MQISIPKWLRSRLLRIKTTEVCFEMRGFRPTVARDHLEAVGRAFLFGYHRALNEPVSQLSSGLERVEVTYRGFAYEGAGMALGLCDSLAIPSQSNWQLFVETTGSAHRYVLYVGLGWAWARLPWRYRQPERYMTGMDPLLKFLVLDGMGFHEGYFYWKNQWSAKPRVPCLSRYGTQVFDQGLGRSLWFVLGGDVDAVIAHVQSIASERQANFWSGIGLAVAYAGPIESSDLAHLVKATGLHRSHFAQGVAFGVEARELAGIGTPQTEEVCNAVWGMPASKVAALTYTARPAFDGDSASEEGYLYEAWRRNLRTLSNRPASIEIGSGI